MNHADLLNFVIAVLVGSLTAYLAKGRGRRPLLWFFVGMFFGLLGMLVLFLFPKAKEQEGKGQVDKEQENTIQVASTIMPPPILLPEEGWFYLNEKHETQGPTTLIDLQVLWSAEKISSTTFIWREGMDGWKKIEELPTLLSHFAIK